MGRLFVFSAPSGAGKTTIVDNLRKVVSSIGYSVSHTSREPRSSEKDGIHYHFVDRETFSRMVDSGAFVEWAEVYENFYGTSFSSLDSQITQGFDVLLDLDAQGAKNIKKHYPDSVFVYVLPPSLEILEKRLRGRGTDDEKVMKLRLEKALNDIKSCAWYDYVIINDDLETAIGDARSIVTSERCRTTLQTQKISELFGISFP
jgi:guanylate kinase